MKKLTTINNLRNKLQVTWAVLRGHSVAYRLTIHGPQRNRWAAIVVLNKEYTGKEQGSIIRKKDKHCHVVETSIRGVK